MQPTFNIWCNQIQWHWALRLRSIHKVAVRHNSRNWPNRRTPSNRMPPALAAAISPIRMKTATRRNHMCKSNTNRVHHWRHCAKNRRWICRSKSRTWSIHGREFPLIRRISASAWAAIAIWAAAVRRHRPHHAISHQSNVNSSQTHQSQTQVSYIRRIRFIHFPCESHTNFGFLL